VGAITVRNLPDEVHGGLRLLAEARQVSVESLVRVVLAEVVRRENDEAGPPKIAGFGEASMPWGMTGSRETTGTAMSEGAPGELWGALRGSVHVPAGTDLTAPLDESWQAEG